MPQYLYHRSRGLRLIKRKSCHYCNEQLAKWERTFDHKIPLCRGGADEQWNIVTACKKCNNDKGPLTDIEYISARNHGIVYEMRLVAEALVRPRLAVEHADKFAEWAMTLPRP